MQPKVGNTEFHFKSILDSKLSGVLLAAQVSHMPRYRKWLSLTAVTSGKFFLLLQPIGIFLYWTRSFKYPVRLRKLLCSLWLLVITVAKLKPKACLLHSLEKDPSSQSISFVHACATAAASTPGDDFFSFSKFLVFQNFLSS